MLSNIAGTISQPRSARRWTKVIEENYGFFLRVLRELRGETIKCINIYTVTSSARKLFGGSIPDAGAKDAAGQAKR